MPPVEYSAVMTRAPSTAMASCPKYRPASELAVVSMFARSCASTWLQLAVSPQANSVVKPTLTMRVASRVQRVDRTDQSLVHSDRATLAKVVPLEGTDDCWIAGAAVAIVSLTSPSERW